MGVTNHRAHLTWGTVIVTVPSVPRYAWDFAFCARSAKKFLHFARAAPKTILHLIPGAAPRVGGVQA